MLNNKVVDGNAERMLKIRQELGKTSTKKYDAIKATIGIDGRVRGLLQFYGANRTGRWAGRLVQMQNLARTYIEVFRNVGDVYCATASSMFRVPVEKHGANSELRQKGKIAKLACIAEGQLVLTNKGLVPIEKVTLNHKLWDGEEWVKNDGVIYCGEKDVIEYEGLTATPDNLVWIEGQTKPIQFGIAAMF